MLQAGSGLGERLAALGGAASALAEQATVLNRAAGFRCRPTAYQHAADLRAGGDDGAQIDRAAAGCGAAPSCSVGGSAGRRRCAGDRAARRRPVGRNAMGAAAGPLPKVLDQNLAMTPARCSTQGLSGCPVCNWSYGLRLRNGRQGVLWPTSCTRCRRKAGARSQSQSRRRWRWSGLSSRERKARCVTTGWGNLEGYAAHCR